MSSTSWRNLIAFWIAGLVNNFGYVVMLSAAQDLIGKSVAPAAVLLANILPGFIMQLLCPWVQDRVPWKLRMLLTCVLGVASFLLAALFDSVAVRLAGVALGSMGSSFGEMTCLAYSSFFHKNTVSAWSSGTGAAGLAGALFYWLATGPIGASYATTLLAFSWVPAVEGLMFFFVMERPVAPLHFVAEAPDARATPLSVNDVATDSAGADAYPEQRSASARYLPIAGALDDKLSDGVRSAPPSIPNYNEATADEYENQPLLAGAAAAADAKVRDDAAPLGLGRRMRLLAQLSPYMLPLALVYFAEYLINQTVYSTVFYRDAALIECSKQYTFLQLCYQTGVLISRSSVNLVRLKNLATLQLPAVFQVINLVVLTLNSVYLYLPSFWLVVAFGVWEGLMGGGIYVNVFYLVSERFDGREKEFCLGSTTQAYGLSITLAAVVGIFFQPFLLERSKVDSCGLSNMTMGNMTTNVTTATMAMMTMTTA